MFNFPDKESLLNKIRDLGLDIPFSLDLDILLEPIEIAGRKIANRLCVLPMEGCDATPKGAPGELTFRRYKRFAAGGSGIIWFEATTVVREGRSNPRQLYLRHETADGFKRLVDSTRKSAAPREPLLLLQLTHSGRFSRPEGAPRPVIACHDPLLDARQGLEEDHPLITDEELDGLQEIFIEAAILAKEAGFDGVDVKACHGYLVSELLASFDRENSRYGGPFENRTRFLREVSERIRDEVPGFIVTSRLNAFDARERGFATDGENPDSPDLSETKDLIHRLQALGYPMLGLSLGIPYLKPHFGRPYNVPLAGGTLPEEHPLRGVARLIRVIGDLQQAFPGLPMVGAGYSWLRHYFPHVGAGVLEEGKASVIGMGRNAFAYPDSAKDLMEQGALDPRKTCVACSRCTQIMRDGGSTGCAVRDREMYHPIYKEGRRRAESREDG